MDASKKKKKRVSTTHHRPYSEKKRMNRKRREKEKRVAFMSNMFAVKTHEIEAVISSKFQGERKEGYEGYMARYNQTGSHHLPLGWGKYIFFKLMAIKLHAWRYKYLVRPLNDAMQRD